ncbi:MAG: DUF2914 domain-containing protein [Candidatus Aminicenantes bacterium]|nr:DUF2914 domain-containing protein [Candidatus Aminicenantes bacterium]
MRNSCVLAGALVFCALGAWAAVQEQQEEPVPAPAATLVVEEGVICTDVVDRVPQGTAATFPSDVGRLYAFTKIAGGVEGAVVKHLWYHGEDLRHTQELAIGGSPWRTWSRKTIPPDRTGAWKVEIRDGEDNIIATLNFTVE